MNNLVRYVSPEPKNYEKIIFWSHSVPFENGVYRHGWPIGVDYAILRIHGPNAMFEVYDKKGLAINSAILEKIVSRYTN